MSYTKTINPAYEQVGKRKRLTGYLAELHDGNMLLHSQEYSTNSQAEQALDRIVYDILSDQAEQGLVDDVAAACEAEGVTSTHLPSWQESPHAPSLTQAIALGLVGTPDPICELCNAPAFVWCDGQMFCQAQWQQGKCLSVCANCHGPHHTWQCPAIRALLFAEPVVMVMDVDLIAEAGILVTKLEEMEFELCADHQAEGRFPPSVMTYHNRLCRILAKAERRLQRREFAEFAEFAEMADYRIVSQSPFCAEPDNHCSVHTPCPAHAADAARYLAQQSLTTWQPASMLVEDLPF